VSLNVKKTLLKARSLSRQGDLESAARLYRTVLSRFPGNTQAIRGLQSLGSGRSPEGQASVSQPQRSIQELVHLYNAGKLEQALTLGQQLASLCPNEPIVHNVLGATNSGLGRHERAIANFARAIQLMPDYAEAYNNLGTALNLVGRHEDAIASYTEALRLVPSFFEAHNNLGNALKDVGRYDEALSSYGRAIHWQPDFADAHNNLGAVLGELGRYQEGIESCANALRLRPGFTSALAKMIHQQAHICDWEAIESAQASIADLGLARDGVSPFSLLHMEDNPARQRKRSEVFASQKFQRQDLPGIARPELRPQPLRIAYFSADFHDHATMYLMAKLFELHDTRNFSIHAYSYGPDLHDGMRRRLKQAVAVFHDVRHLGDRAICELSRSEKIDIAVDLKGYTQHARPGIFAYRAAPIQISYLGYPGTMGAPFIDYIIADEFVIPARQREHYCEQVIYLPHTYQVNDDSREISARQVSRSEAGLPETGFVFCCFNNSYKISSREFDIWMRLLQQVQGSVLWLIKSNRWAQQNLQLEASKRGVDPQRIVFADRMPLPEHLARHRLADLFLDTFIYNAHTTASDALWAGVPVITLPGQGFAARVAGSLLTATGLPELIAASEQDYENLALELALNPQKSRALKEKLASARLAAPLFNTELFTRHIEDAYRLAYQRYFDGKPADTIFVKDSGAALDRSAV
jgi:predicted O-linked N-acetylglucosamine transferase (SPINDLY family)